MTNIAIYGANVLTVNDRNQLFKRGTVIIENGSIRSVRKTQEKDTTLDTDHLIDGSGKLVMPGLVNAHSHLEMTALLGAFSEMNPSELLFDIAPLFQQLGRGEYGYLVEASCELAALNFIQGGITTVNAMDARSQQSAETFGEVGLRGFFGPMVSDLFWDIPVDDQFDRIRSFIEDYHDSYEGRIKATICPHDDWACSRDVWERIASLAAEYPDLPVHTHLLELKEGNTMARANGAEDSLALLEDIGLLDDRLVAAHFRVADSHDVRRIADNNAAVAHCPSVFCYWSPDGDAPWTPVPDLRDAGATVSLGLDDHYWHDSSDLFEEARQTRLAANLSFGANQFNSMELIRMLTIEGARALGVGDEIGSLEAGKRADMILLDVSKPKFVPQTNLPALVTNTASVDDVETTIVDGEILMHDGEVTTMDTERVSKRVREATERFTDETDWQLGTGGSSPPSRLTTMVDMPKSGPTHLLSRLGLQHLRELVTQ